MAETAVRFLIQTLNSLLQDEGSLIWGLHKEMHDIKLELQSMQSFLRDADMKQHSQESLKTWVEQVRNLAYDVEDIIDKYQYRMTKHHKGGLQGAIFDMVRLPVNIFYRRQIAARLQDIKANIQATFERRNRFSLSSDGSSLNGVGNKLQFYGESSIYVSEDDVVGIEKKGELLIRWLTHEEPQRVAYAVVGMGGLGKTTLVSKTYNSQMVKRCFDCYAWVTVSQSYNLESMLRSMIKEFTGSSPGDANQKEYRELVQVLINHLQRKRYILILDDLWSIDAWEKIKVALPKNKLGSRIMITTRDQEVASHVAELQNNVFPLQPLNENEAWTLFCRKAFKNCPDKSCPQRLEPLALNIVKKCDGLPLAIVTIGSLMSQKEDMAEWRNVEASFSWLLSNNRFLERVKNVILLSYYELPCHLKHCFLYCCTFPEDFAIYEAQLMDLLVAEGFINEIKGLHIRDVAKGYINELACRSMIQSLNTDYPSNIYQVHDVVRDVGSSIAEDENFFMFSSGKEDMLDRKARRLSMQVDSEFYTLCAGTCNLRSYLAFRNKTSLVTSFHPRLKLLRVLLLENTPINNLPDVIGELFNLRYLSLKNTKISKLPNSLRKLRNLQTLNIYGTKVEKLPSWMVRLKKLQSLLMGDIINNNIRVVTAPTGICMLKCLHRLSYVEANNEIVRKIGRLTQLRGLGIKTFNEVNGEDICMSIQRMNDLLELHIEASKGQKPLELEALSSPPPFLRNLWLKGNLERLPSWVSSLKNIVYLSLAGSYLREDALSYIQALPDLEYLSFGISDDVHELYFRASFFQKLKILKLYELRSLEMIEIEDGAMPSLEIMYIWNYGLEKLPKGIEYLKQLQLLALSGCPEGLVNELKALPNIQHIPEIRHYFAREGTWQYANISNHFPASGSIEWRRKCNLRMDFLNSSLFRDWHHQKLD